MAYAPLECTQVWNMALNSRHAHRNISKYMWGEGQKLMTDRNATPDVLHQYDRHRSLAKCVAHASTHARTQASVCMHARVCVWCIIAIE